MLITKVYIVIEDYLLGSARICQTMEDAKKYAELKCLDRYKILEHEIIINAKAFQTLQWRYR